MKNMKKLVALFAATTMAMSLSVAAFAAPSLSNDKATLTFADGDFKADQAQVTMMAYIVEGTGYTTDSEEIAYVDQEIIALDQDSTIPSVKVDAKKITEGTTVVIKTSGSKGEVQTFLLEQTVTATGKTVTFMNGATATPVVEADGKVTLPTDVAWNGGTPVTGATFKLYSWVTEDGTEYVIGDNTEIDFGAALTEDTVLYAKYDTGILCGDIDFADGVDATDAFFVANYGYYGENYLPDALNKPLYEGSKILIGDIDGADGVDATDAFFVANYGYYGENYLPDSLNKKIYLINGHKDGAASITAVYAD